MPAHTVAYLSDAALRRELHSLAGRDCTTTADLLAHIAEFDSRGLFVADGYPSMFSYCVEQLHMSEDVACNRIHAARAARQFPLLFEAIGEGRLHLAAVRLLAPHLTAENVAELIAVATHQGKTQIERMLAMRFAPTRPTPKVVQSIRAIPTRSVGVSAPGRMDPLFQGLEQAKPVPVPAPASSSSAPVSAPRAAAPASAPQTALPAPAPPSSERFLLQVTMSKGTHDKLRHAQLLLSHSIPSGNVEQVLERAFDALIGQLEKRKLAATSHPRRAPRPSTRKRHIPAHVRRIVWQRDGGRCTFVSESGVRCPARQLLEFDHIDPVARGGRATADRMRLRCRAHNQYEAERVFGAEFMRRKRGQARPGAEAKTGRLNPP